MAAPLSFRLSDIIPMETLDDMGRRRHQQPNVFKTSGKRPMWYFKARVDAIKTNETGRTIERPSERFYLGFADEIGKQEAKKRRDEILSEVINKPQVLIPSQIKFSELLKLYRREALPLVRPTTRSTYEAALKHIEKLGDLRMCDITTLELQRWVNGLELAFTTKRQYLAIVRIIWGCAIDWEYTQQVWPGRKVKLGVRRDVKGRDMPTLDQIRRLLAELEDPYRAMAEIALVTGLRISELRGLQWADIGATALVVSRRLSADNDCDVLKNGKQKVFDIRPLLPIFQRVRCSSDVNAKLRANTASRGDFIFADAGCYSSCQLKMKAARRVAGITTARFNWHHLRAIFNTLVRQAGADSTDRQAMMGHSSERQNRAYIYAEGEDLRRRGEQMLQVQSLVMGRSKGVQ